MLTAFVVAALREASYEKLDDDTYYGEITGFEGVYANESTLAEGREELRHALEDWTTLGIKLAHHLPAFCEGATP